MHVSSSLIGAQFGDFNQIINENDGTSRVCVIFMDDSTVMVQGILRTANSTAIGIMYNLSIIFHNNFITVCTYTPSLSVSPSPSYLPLSLPINFIPLYMLFPSAGFDYEELIQVFSIQGGEEKCFDLIIYDDNLPEPNERIILELNSSNNALRSLITSQLTIVDDDGKYVRAFIDH